MNIRGWLPRDSIPSHPGKRRVHWLRSQWILSCLLFEVAFIFAAGGISELVGFGMYSSFITGFFAFPGFLIGLILFMPKKIDGLYAQVGDVDFQPEQLTHIVEWLGGIVIEGEVATGNVEFLQKLSLLQKGDVVSYNLLTDKRKMRSGNARLRRTSTLLESNGKTRFSISMK